VRFRLLQPTQALTNLPSAAGHPQNRAKIYYVVQSHLEVDRAIKQLQARINEVSHGGIHEKFDILFLLNAESLQNNAKLVTTIGVNEKKNELLFRRRYITLSPANQSFP